jgi:predicted bacteriocin transport accessory protein
MSDRKLICGILGVLIVALCAFIFLYYQNHLILMRMDEENNTEESEISQNTSNNQSSSSNVIYPTTFEEVENYINRDKITFLVIGKTTCHFCTSYKPVLTQISKDENIEIVYVEADNLSEEDYSRLLNSEITIPAKCSNTGEDAQLNVGFGTPLNLFIQNGESVNCMRGYKDYDSLKTFLQSISYIS